MCRRDTGQIAAVFNTTNMLMGPFRSAFVGYYAFKSLKLHRLEANMQPGNAASIALVKSCGFAPEGYSPRYLKIGGRWRDQERWAIVTD